MDIAACCRAPKRRLKKYLGATPELQIVRATLGYGAATDTTEPGEWQNRQKWMRAVCDTPLNQNAGKLLMSLFSSAVLDLAGKISQDGDE